MAPCLSKFPSLCLEAIFSHVPLVDLLRSIGLVCTSWYSSRRTELIRRRRLVIVQFEEQLETLNSDFIYCSHEVNFIEHVRRDDGSPWLSLESLEKVQFDAVPHRMLTISFVSLLLVLSHITHFDLMFDAVSSCALAQVIRLIKHFSEHLVDLRLSIICFSDNDSDDSEDDNDFDGDGISVDKSYNVAKLFASLERLQSLRHLKLVLDFSNIQIRPQMSFLSRLTTFVLHARGHDDAPDWILSSLLQYGRNIDLIELYHMAKWHNYLQVGLQLGTKFNALHLDLNDVVFEDFDNMKLLCTHFSSLTILTLYNCTLPMTMFSRCLTQVAQLVQLDLRLVELEVEEPDEDGEQPQIAQVTSVRLLDFSFATTSHHDSEMLFIPEIFPNLQVLRLRHRISECAECSIPNSQIRNHDLGWYPTRGSRPRLARRLAQCARLTRQPFRRCANLHTIQVDNSYVGDETHITVNEL